MLTKGWETVALGKVATLQRGYDLPTRERTLGLIPIVTSSGIGGTHAESRVTGPGVVTGRYGTIGEVFFLEQDFWPLNTTLFVKDFHGNDPLFVSYLLRTIDFQSYSGKSGVPGVNRNDLHGLDVALPPLPEQRAIAGALGDVDALIGALENLIAKKRDLKQAAMQQLLTGQTRLPGFKGEWDVARIGEHASIKTGSKNTQDRVADGKYPFFVRSQQIERINTYSYDGEAVLTAGDGVGTGKVFHYIRGRFDVHQRVYMIAEFSDQLHGRYFFYQFSTRFYDRIMSMTAKSSVDSVRMEMIAGMQIPLPSSEEQHAIAAVLSDMDAEIAALEARLAKTSALKQGMMQELLTGRIRLIDA
jgi:type I restriction enzyme, S subunit